MTDSSSGMVEQRREGFAAEHPIGLPGDDHAFSLVDRRGSPGLECRPDAWAHHLELRLLPYVADQVDLAPQLAPTRGFGEGGGHRP